MFVFQKDFTLETTTTERGRRYADRRKCVHEPRGLDDDDDNYKTENSDCGTWSRKLRVNETKIIVETMNVIKYT